MPIVRRHWQGLVRLAVLIGGSWIINALLKRRPGIQERPLPESMNDRPDNEEILGI